MGSTLQSLNIREMSAARRAQFVEWLQLWLPWAGQQQVERAIWNECHDASKICTWGLEELINIAKQKYILTCWDVWRLGGWCDKVSGCYWPEMTVKAVFANFTATSADICLLLLRSPSLPRLRRPQRQFEETKILNTKRLRHPERQLAETNT